jgi:hypothetical protein
LRHYLVVANHTLGRPPLTERLLSLHRAEPCDFHLVVPATLALDHVRWTRGEAIALARRRLYGALDQLRLLGLDVHGELGDPSPIIAITEVLRHRSFHELIVATLPPGPSVWLRRQLPQRIEALFGLPVTLVVGDTVVLDEVRDAEAGFAVPSA